MKVSGKHYRSIWAEKGHDAVHIIDQSRLPHVFETLRLDSPEAVAEAIKLMRVRGAPLIGVTAHDVPAVEAYCTLQPVTSTAEAVRLKSSMKSFRNVAPEFPPPP